MMAGMSYSVTIKASGGTVEVSTSGDVPDGTITVSGHDSHKDHSLSVNRSGADGRVIQSAGAHDTRE